MVELPPNVLKLIHNAIKTPNDRSTFGKITHIPESTYMMRRRNLSKCPLKTSKGANKYQKSIKNQAGTDEFMRKTIIKQMIPKHIVKVLFPGYGGYNTIDEYFAMYNSNQLIRRVQTMINNGNKRYNKKIKELLNKI